jgi:putative acetyltransferase
MTLIRPELPSDVGAIRAVDVACFPTDAEARLVDLLRGSGSLSVSLVAELDGEIVGHVTFSPVASGTGDTGAGLAPLAVLAPHRRRGVGAELVTSGIEACRAAGIGWVVVLGEPGYYARFGFTPGSDAGLVDEYGGGPAFQALELRGGALPRGAGLVRYAPEFASLEQP